LRVYTGHWRYRPVSFVDPRPDGTGRREERVLLSTKSCRYWVDEYRDTGMSEQPPAQAALFSPLLVPKAA